MDNTGIVEPKEKQSQFLFFGIVISGETKLMVRVAFKTHRTSTLVMRLLVALTAVTLTTQNLAFDAPDAKQQEQTAQDSRPTDVGELKIGEPIGRELAGGAAHSYRVSLTQGQYLKVVVDQKGIDVVIRVFGPDGQKLREVDETPAAVLESTFLIAEAAGVYRVEVGSSSNDAKSGTYEIKIKDLREATAKDRIQISAQKVFDEANKLRDQQTAESQRKAIVKWEEALPLWREAGDRQSEAHTLIEIGAIYSQLGENQKALDCFGQALPLYRAVENRQYEAVTLNNIGDVYLQKSETQKALEFYNQALPVSRGIQDRQTEATALGNIGRVYFVLGERRRAIEYFDQVLSIRRELGDRWREAVALANLGATYDSLGEFKKTLEYYGQALATMRLSSNHAGEAAIINNMGLTYFKLGEFQKALEHYDQSLPITRVTGDRMHEGYTLDNIGRVYEQMGEPQKALQYFNEALEVRRAIAHRIGQALTLTRIGAIYLSLGEPGKALEYFEQSLSIQRATSNRNGEAASLDSIGAAYFSLGELQKALDYHNQSLSIRKLVGDRLGEASTLANIGTVHRELGELRKALDYFDQALALSRTLGDRVGEADTLNYIGSIHDKLGDKNKALEYYTQALSLSRAIGSRREEAAILLNAARMEQARDNMVEARRQVEGALDIIESTRSKVANQSLRSSYLASKQDYYTFYINLLMQMHRSQPSSGYDAAALQASERARARGLLEILTESRADIRQGVDPELLQRERSLQQQLNTKSERLTTLLRSKHTPEQETTARKDVESVLASYQDIEAQIRARSPAYAALTQPQPLSLREIQQLLDKDTLLLEYALDEKRSFLWAVTPTSIKSFELSKRSEIEAAATRFYQLVTTRKNRELDAQTEAAAALSRLLLGPVADQLGRKRLLIVSDGTLNYIPFAALAEPLASDKRSDGNGKTANKYQPLVVKHEIVSLPSASVLAVMRRELAGRPPSPKSVAVLADPVFRNDDPRIRSGVSKVAVAANGSGNKNDLKSDLERSAWEAGVEDLQRLPHTREEAEAIVKQAQANQALLALDFTANRTTAFSEQLGQHRIIHFATHGLLNNVHPELSGIVLSLVDEAGRPQNGFVRLHEVYNLKLPAELVVLSGCQTALGKQVKGEGLVGLTRGFMYAGAARVVVSLWPVSDAGTAELMKRFYQGMLGRGLRPAAALREAQIDMWKNRWWEAPYYWAGFGLQGEWR
ncbi:MAG TPA: CHAT domain-containing tetratricopeptide repeat protein [Pyrinomonadaceae bacterium]|nr:CHAT domain-containing tetratricopeptide repeat protein [Pyrinomonadaceae bacterium]